MKKYLQQVNRIISLVMVFVLLIQQYGCVTSTSIPARMLPIDDPSCAYAVHCGKTVYILEKIAVQNDTLSGKIFNTELEILQTDSFIHVYPESDSLVKISSDKILSIPLEYIKKVKSTKEAPRKTAYLVIGGLLLALFTILIISSGNSLNTAVDTGP